ncbi:hypothetical protein TELCIR_04615 [Teladorsagia circumcincta]|uniref:Peptidase A1 domain-containing protein n=1 Tax=Teladorsagia circumcincta TaxID=45464 RepID=A0A2G9UT33_TELCI|nr:hypothetical protein TELCIR_04615 [Teladorsagia circumcincta]
MANDEDTNTHGGVMTLCGMDPSHYQGPIAWEPLTVEDYWRINLRGVSIQDYTIAYGPISAIVDTGTSLIAGPTDAIQTVILWNYANMDSTCINSFFIQRYIKQLELIWVIGAK